MKDFEVDVLAKKIFEFLPKSLHSSADQMRVVCESDIKWALQAVLTDEEGIEEARKTLRGNPLGYITRSVSPDTNEVYFCIDMSCTRTQLEALLILEEAGESEKYMIEQFVC